MATCCEGKMCDEKGTEVGRGEIARASWSAAKVEKRKGRKAAVEAGKGELWCCRSPSALFCARTLHSARRPSAHAAAHDCELLLLLLSAGCSAVGPISARGHARKWRTKVGCVGALVRRYGDCPRAERLLQSFFWRRQPLHFMHLHLRCWVGSHRLVSDTRHNLDIESVT